MQKSPVVPPGECLYAVGDIHGRADLLKDLVAMIAEDAAQHSDEKRTLIFLGDYIDRGPDSCGVIEFLMSGLPTGVEAIFLRGNHEDYALKFLHGNLAVGPSWLHFGGTAFLASYGVNAYRPNLLQDLGALHSELLEKMPAAHRAFLEATRFFHSSGDYYFVHAGVRPDVALEKQEATDQMWIRDDFLSSDADFGKIVVHGHSIVMKPDVQNNRIGIDSGAYATGHLTALKLRGSEQRFFTT